jgi:DNA repair exonuclease SbcCD nuclease subunit
MFEFLHAADIHLDSPLRGLQRYEGAPLETIREASRHAFKNLVDLALNDRVAFLLIAGDLYDGDWKDYNTGLFFVQQMARLRDAGIPVVLIAGNHDAANKMTRLLKLPDNVRMLSVNEPESIEWGDLGVAVHGQGFAQAKVTDDLSQHYPRRKDGFFNIGLLHTCAAGADGHERYAPCTLDGLRGKGYDYWALGHIHKREILCADPLVVFPGNLQGRHIREAGAKGCMRVRVNDNGQAAAQFQTLDVMRWELCQVSAAEVNTPHEIVEAVIGELRRLHDFEPMPLAVRVRVTGATEAHPHLLAGSERWINEVRAAARSELPGEVWLEEVEWRTQLPRGQHALPDDGPYAELSQVLADIRNDGEAWNALLTGCDDLQQLLTKVQCVDPGANSADPEWRRGLLDQVECVLKERLLAREERA